MQSYKKLFIALFVAVSLFILFKKKHYEFDAQQAKDSTFYITDITQSTGGTGFQVQAKSGTTVLVTNSHVCMGVANHDKIVYVRHGKNDMAIPRRIIYDSPDYDLCLVEPMPNKGSVLEVGDTFKPLDKVYVVGHPRLLDINLAEGRAIERGDQLIFEGPVTEEHPCTQPKEVKQSGIFGSLCFIKEDIIVTSVVGLPGNSGSPAIGEDGKVHGVVAVGFGGVNWLGVVPSEYLLKVLEQF